MHNMEHQEVVKKLPGQPNLKLHYTPDKAIEIPIFIISNAVEKRLFAELFNRYMNLGRYLIHRKLSINEPYAGVDEYNQFIYAEKTLDAIFSIALKESVKFQAITSIQVDKVSKYFNSGMEVRQMPEHYKQHPSSRQSQNNIDDFCSHYGIDSTVFRYPDDRLYGKYSFDD